MGSQGINERIKVQGQDPSGRSKRSPTSLGKWTRVSGVGEEVARTQTGVRTCLQASHLHSEPLGGEAWPTEGFKEEATCPQ